MRTAIFAAGGAARWLVAAVVVAGCGWLGWAGVRTWRATADVATAQQLALSGSAAAARPYLRLAGRYRPDNAKPWRLLAQFSAFARPRRALEYARRAVSLDPDDWRNWDRLGLVEYQLDDVAGARRALAQAVRHDSGWEAHYRLGNFALLLGNHAEFWQQMGDALAIVAASKAGPLLEQAINVAFGQPAELLAALPRDRAGINAAAVRLLLRRQRPLAAAAVWKRMECRDYQRADCRSAVLALTNGLLTAAFQAPQAARGRGVGMQAGPAAACARPAACVAAAVRAWNQGVARQVLDAAPARTGAVSDGDFRRQWVGPSFAWVQTGPVFMSLDPGVAPEGNAVRIDFDGYEPEATGLLRQYVSVQPGAAYEVSYWTRRQGEGSQTGVDLRVLTPAQVLLQLQARLGEQWAVSRATFQVPRSSHLIALFFGYHRPMGQVRLSNPVLLADVRLQRLSR